MAKNSKIEWCDHTFNPWLGCTRVSPGCVNCYAESFVRRYGKAEWGSTAQRVRTSPANWREPLAWNRKALREGRRYKVFCASLADVFEDNPQLTEWRYDLWALIDRTRHLDWLLLTKRPENIAEMLPLIWLESEGIPPNLWLGTSVENQESADKRIPELLKLPAAVRFLSCEPLLGPLDLSWYLAPRFAADDPRHEPWRNGVEWVICGGESGPKARPMHPDWARRLLNQCNTAGVPFFYKQHGAWLHRSQVSRELQLMLAGANAFGHSFTYHKWGDGSDSIRLLGKSLVGEEIGRQLDGYEWNEMPANSREACK